MAISNSNQSGSLFSGDKASLDKTLQKYEGYLKLLAEVQLGQMLQSRIGASDVLQETLLKAAQGWDQFRGTTEAELLGWLKKILLNNVHQAIQFHTAGKRSIRREISLDRMNAMHLSTAALDHALIAQISSPSEPAKRHETVLIVADCLAELDEKCHQIILLRTLLGKPYSEIAQRLGKSEAACRMMWLRAIKALRPGFEKRNLL